ncbi:hypothetical protein K1720_00105 [Thermococcus argininiproducens]|uniref:Uncharacterized protein n=1 Tax=Thermococcus argininiproducens TaxID=2866384 RepID=A0A9E7MB07_9EURY|nr:hypothetical protein [Thermococcus argininiproducens]USG99931.1 hypothetical protein K1720_00105 [Thermococcus argininiproducens]
MNIRKLLLGAGLVVILYGLFFSRAIILETNSENSPMLTEQNFKQCSVKIKVRELTSSPP